MHKRPAKIQIKFKRVNILAALVLVPVFFLDAVTNRLFLCVLWSGIDSWLNLTKVDPDEEVQGEIHLSLELLKGIKKSTLRCQVIEAR